MDRTEQASELLKKIDDYNKAENLSSGEETLAANDPRLIAASLELAGRTKSILSGLYFDFRKPGTSTLRKLRNKVIDKIARVTRSTVERPFLTQQKFNEQSYYLLKVLLEENKQLKAEIEQIKAKLSPDVTNP